MPLMKDGFKTLITFSRVANVGFAETRVKLPGMSARGPIDLTSMRNSTVTTKWPKQLVDFTNVTVTVQWDPLFWNSVRLSLLRINQSIVILLPTGNALTFHGWLDGFEPNEHAEGEVPTAVMTIVLGNLRHDDLAETSPQMA